MSKENYSISSGVKHLNVVVDGRDTGRTIDFNPADNGFAESIYCLVSKLSAIHEEKEKEYKAEETPEARFDIRRAEDMEMREAVDALFGDGFSRDVFKTRLFALVDGVTVIEDFLFGVLDKMDEAITQNLSKREQRIRKYTDKYSKYTKNH